MQYPVITTMIRPLIETQTKAISVQDAKQWLQTHAPIQYRKFVHAQAFTSTLYRGSNAYDPHQITIIDPTKGSFRSARNTGDLYRAIADLANPNWPQRSRSVITTTSALTAQDYGYICRVIPYDNNLIAVAPQSDMWDTAIKWPNTVLTDLLGIVRHVVNNIKYPDRYVLRQAQQHIQLAFNSVTIPAKRDQDDRPTSWFHESGSKILKTREDVIRMLDTIRTQIDTAIDQSTSPAEGWIRLKNRVRFDVVNGNNSYSTEIASTFYEWMVGTISTPTLVDNLIYRSRYESLGFELITGSDPVPTRDVECWTESPCLCIPITADIDDIVSG